MGTLYNQLTLDERYQIQALSKLDFSAREVARRLDRSNKTVSKELRRCSPGAYCAKTAHRNADVKKRTASKNNGRTEDVIRQIDWLLGLDLTPEQIAGRMTLEGCAQSISRQSIYRYIAYKQWRHRLPRKGKRYRQRKGAEAGVHLIPHRVDIDKRPAIVEENSELGHWEGDTVYGQDGYFVTLVERVSKVFLTMKVKNKTKKLVSLAIRKLLKPYQHICKTITFDNGGEFADHRVVANALKCKIYFAKPYQSWQRGLNENTNGLLRRYYPKGMKIGALSKQQIEQVQFTINMRPRKALDYLSPYEFLAGKRVSLMLSI
jgi:IS30 family transposase